jgi:DNA primase
MSVLDDIKAKLDIVDVVEGYVTLRRSGSTLKANCPFHTEKTPSFIVTPARQTWRCFGACATGGDIFSFVMRAENMEFGDALRLLARRAGVELGRSGDRSRANAVHKINAAAAVYYQDVLKSEAGAKAREYLDSRGVGLDARDKFKLGLSPDRWDGLKTFLQTHGYKREDAVSSGLLREDENGDRSWDFFRHRLMFPIFNRDGEVAGFGARALDDSTPKYINTSQTSVFDKRSIVYALNFAASKIRESGSAVIVEGYMDAIAAHERGYTNVVASMGTALTENQVSLLRPLAQEFVLALDPDAAGQEATLRSLESSWQVFRSVVARRGRTVQSVLDQQRPPILKIAALPAGLDPDALIRSDPKAWESTIANSKPLLDFVIPALIERSDPSVPDSRARIAALVAPLIDQLDPIDQYGYWVKLADGLGVPVDTLRAAIGDAGRRAGRGRGATPRQESGRRVEVSSSLLETRRTDAVEEYVLSMLIHHPDLVETAWGSRAEWFRYTENRELFTAVLESPTIEALREEADPVLQEHLARLEASSDSGFGLRHEREAALTECLKRLELRHVKDSQATYLLLLTEEDGLPPSDEIESQVNRINHRIKQLQPTGRARPTSDMIT